MINEIFTAAVSFLNWLAHMTGFSYQAVNVFIFIVIWPIVTLALIASVIVQQRAIRRLRPQHSPSGDTGSDEVLTS
jgi:hypothetical protein